MANTELGSYKLLSATLRGVEAVCVNVEVSVFKGMPNFSIVGMPDTSIQESKERIRAAIKSSGFCMPDSRIVANLAPGSIKKSGSGFDLPIALAMLLATKQIKQTDIRDYLIVGELALDGSVRSVPGILAYAKCAKNANKNLLSSGIKEQSVDIKGLAQMSVNNLRDFNTSNFIKVRFKRTFTPLNTTLDFCDIYGHDIAKRALQIAACGEHGVIMVGPPGAGKSMLAERMPSILPPLKEPEKLESAIIHSISGESVDQILKGNRPFRSPHHSATLPGLIGGGNPTRPGEVSLAHNGVLYMDELAEFSTHVLQGIRQPLETGKVTIIRADGAITFPAKFSLIAATNPCPCGYFGDDDHECRCSQTQIHNYQMRIGGPILDRIDMHLDIERIRAKDVLQTGKGLGSDSLLNGVLVGLEYKNWRLRKEIDEQNKVVRKEVLDKNLKDFSHSKGAMDRLVKSCRLSDKDFVFFEKIATQKNFSGRSIMKVLSVARTIADLAQSYCVNHDHLCESLTFRVRNKENIIL